jgi:hypothetical protein
MGKLLFFLFSDLYILLEAATLHYGVSSVKGETERQARRQGLDASEQVALAVWPLYRP